MALRPRWFDLPMIVWCCCPFAASISNGDGTYDGLSQSLIVIFMWGLPYLIGRLYFGNLDGMRALAIGIVAGGVAYILPCLWEIRMSPHLSQTFYGIGGWGGIRLGGYRPRVFLSTGLELGTWMSAASLAAWWLWKAGTLKRLAGFDFGKIVLPSLLITNLLCKSSGALMLCLLGMACLWGSTRFKTKVLLLCIIMIAPTYYAVRISGTWSGEGLVDFLKARFDPERAWSLEFRFLNENLLIQRALERPLIGWGGWGRALMVDPAQLERSGLLKTAIPDGLWVIALGNTGTIGLASISLVILLPSIVFLRRFPVREWTDPLVAPSAVFAVILSLYMADCLMNGMVNLIYVVAMGGLVATLPDRHRMHANHSHYDSMAISRHHPDETDESSSPQLALPSSVSSKEILAKRYADLGRSLAQQGRTAEAKSIWFQSLDHWTRLTSEHPGIARFCASWCDCCNDLAWFLLNQPSADPQDLSQALDLIIKATEASPDQATYWNTLGAAYYRAGDDQSAVAALHHSISLQQNQGNGFDYLYLALACSRSHQQDIAHSWYEQGIHWINEHGYGNYELQELRAEAEADLTQLERSETGI